MLEQRDLEAIASLLDSKLEKNNEQMKRYIDERFEKNNESMKEFVRQEVAAQITRSESFLLEEMDRMNKSTNSKIDFLQKKIDDLTQYYRVTKLENDNTTLILQLVSRLQRDVEELKKKIA